MAIQFLSQTTGAVVGRQFSIVDSQVFNNVVAEIMLSTIATVRAGRTYKVSAYGEIVSSGAAGAHVVESYVRYTIDNTEPVIGSTALCRAESRNDSTGGVPRTALVQGFYDAATDHTFRAALWSQRVEGTGDVIWTAGTGRPRFLVVEDVGPTITDTGTEY